MAQYRIWWRPRDKETRSRVTHIKGNSIMRRKLDGRTYYSIRNYDTVTMKREDYARRDAQREAQRLRRVGNDARAVRVRRPR